MSLADFFKKPSSSSADPVCGMKIDPDKTQYKSQYQGKTYGFCSEQCQKTFEASPGDYAETTGK